MLPLLYGFATSRQSPNSAATYRPTPIVPGAVGFRPAVGRGILGRSAQRNAPGGTGAKRNNRLVVDSGLGNTEPTGFAPTPGSEANRQNAMYQTPDAGRKAALVEGTPSIRGGWCGPLPVHVDATLASLRTMGGVA